MSAATEALRESLRVNAAIQTSETELSNALLDSFVAAALIEHNPLYTAENLPVNENELVVLLSWIRVCHWRAQAAARDGDLNQGGIGYGEDRSSPIQGNLKMAEALRKRYDRMAALLGLASNTQAGQVVVSTMFVEDALLSGVRVPVTMAAVPPKPVLGILPDVGDSTVAVVSWQIPSFSDFDAYYLLQDDTGLVLFQEWNFNSSTGIPRTPNNANLLATIRTKEITALKVTDMDPLAANSYILVARSTAGKYSYSNVVTVLDGAVVANP